MERIIVGVLVICFMVGGSIAGYMVFCDFRGSKERFFLPVLAFSFFGVVSAAVCMLLIIVVCGIGFAFGIIK